MKKLLLFLALSVTLLATEKLKFEVKKIDENLIVVNVLPQEQKGEILNEYPYHKVKKGEYLGGIAIKHKKTTKKLVKINKLKNPNLIYPQQKIYLERKKEINLEEIPDYYIVKSGENLISICYNFDLDWKEVAKLNKLENITQIYPGQKIILK